MGGAEHKVALADDYLSAASALTKTYGIEKPQSLPVMFLIYHALELLLKAYIEIKCPADKKKYRHDLGRLWEYSKSVGLLFKELNAQGEIDTIVSYLKDGHENYQFRYADKSFSFSGPIMTEDAIRKVRTAVLDELTVHLERRRVEAEKDGMVMYQAPAGIFISIERG